MNHVADLEALKRDLCEAMMRALVQFRLLESQIRGCRTNLKQCESILMGLSKLKKKDETK